MARKQTLKKRTVAALVRWGATLTPRLTGAIAVTAVAMYASYWHIADTALAHGQDADIAYLMPITIDGLLVVAATYAMAPGVTRSTKITAYGSFSMAWLFSLVANIESAGHGAPLVNQGVASVPAFALLATAVILHLGTRKPRRRPAAKASAAQNPVPVVGRVVKARRSPVSAPVSPSPLLPVGAGGNQWSDFRLDS